MIRTLHLPFHPGRHKLGLQTRFMVWFGLIVITLMATVVWLVEKRMSSTLVQQTQMRGVAIANSIAATVKSELLSYDYVSLQQAAETTTHDEGLLYVIILNKESVVAGYSGHPELQGRVLDDAVSRSIAAAVGSRIQRYGSCPEEGVFEDHLDIAVPVHVEGTPVRWGTVRVGLSLVPLRSTLAETRLLLVVLGFAAVFIVLVAARLLSRQVIRPLQGLAEATGVIATGDLDHAVDENLVGELGDLARSFNKMTNELKRSRDAIRYQNQHLENMVQLRTSALAEKARELEMANAELKELDRLKGDFLSNVSHELRTPLTSIRSFTEIMLDAEQELTQGERREFLQIVSSQAERLTRLISDLLDLSRIEAGEFSCQPTPMRVPQLTASVVHTLRGLATDKGVRFVNDVPGDLPLAFGDIDRMSQVLTNLVDNAIKFTPAGGTIVLEARASQERRMVVGVEHPGEAPLGAHSGMEARESEPGPYVVLSVRDSGIGIRGADEQRIFDKFGQVGNVLTDKPQGTGLGLAISGSIVVQHGGSLWVESSPGVGSVFSFSIPVVRAEVAGAQDPMIGMAGGATVEADARSARAPGAVTGRPVPAALRSGVDRTVPSGPARELAARRRVRLAGDAGTSDPEALVDAVRRAAAGKQILIVDDEPSIVAALTELLQPLGYRTVGCSSGSQAVARSRELAPDAIILDIMMPEINGYDVLRLLKSEPATAGIPVIVLSVLDDRHTALTLGAAEYVRKPFQKEELLENVRALA